MILLIDNYDSFVFNLARYINELNQETLVVRNDQISLTEIKKLAPTHILISPGPGRPDNAGISVEIIREFFQTIPILGICLGHQAIGYAFGAHITAAKKPMHGKSSSITHNGKGLFQQIPNPCIAGRYHSLIVERNHLPNFLEITACSEDQEIMALQHRQYPLYGLQFHPESILTTCGHQLLKNFLMTEYSLVKKRLQIAL